MIIFIAGCAVVVPCAKASALKCHFHNREAVLDILAVLMPLSEVAKQLLLTRTNGGVYVWWYFPFQLCSMPLYLLPLRQILIRRIGEDSRVIRLLTDFLADFSLLGGIFAFADQSGMHYAVRVLTLHSYLWHFTMIFLGLYLVFSGRHSKDRENAFKTYQGPALLFLFLAAAAELINTLFHNFGEINMFYISPWEPVTQIILKDIAAYTGNAAEIFIYILLILAGGYLIHLLANFYAALLYCPKE